jgi:6-phosphogluconolactonase
MYKKNNFENREQLDLALADKVSEILQQAISLKGKASIAVSGGSTPKGFFKVLSNKDIDWKKVTITLADERWVDIHSDDSNTRLVHENLLQNKASVAKFFHLKQGEILCDETLVDLNVAATNALLPLDVLILGMGEDGHTASLFPCSEQINQGLDSNNEQSLMAVTPTTAPHQRITFSFASLSQSHNTFLHLCGDNKMKVLEKALNGDDVFDMPIRKFLQTDGIDTQVYWAA